MDHVTRLRIEPIEKRHVRTLFACGNPALDEYLKQYARQNDAKNLSKTFVAADSTRRVFGYYSVNASRIEFDELPTDLNQRLPHYPAPAALIARLAVDATLAGQGLGARLLVDALQRISNAAKELAVKVIVVDALDDKARGFYQHFGFVELPGQELKLFVPIETVNRLFSLES